MSERLNALIALGGTGIKSPVQRYNEAKQIVQNEKANRLSMLATKQGMDINNQKMQMLKQEEAYKGMASLGDYLDTIQDPIKKQAAFEQAKGKFQQMGIPPMPEGMGYEQAAGPIKQAQLRVNGVQEKWTQGKTPSGIPYQESTTTGERKKGAGSDIYSGIKGSSEFERLAMAQLRSGKIDAKEYEDMMNKRTGVLAGTDMRVTDEARINEQKRKSQYKETADIRDEYKQGVDHFKSMDNTIYEAMTALDSGDTGLADTMLNQVMSQVQDDSVRAYAMFQQFDKPFGNVANRVSESIERFMTGKRSDAEKAEIRDTLQYFQTAYAQPKRKAMRDRYRALAVENGKDPFVAVPPESPEDIRDTTLVDKKRKKQLLKLYFPEMFSK